MTTGEPWAVLWDVDGTLVDTAELHYRAWVELFREMEHPFTRADFAATFGWRNPEIFAKLCGAGRFSDAEVAALGERKEEFYRAAAGRGVRLLPGAAALLEGLRRAEARQAIGSSAPRANVELILEMTGAGAYFGAVASMEDTRRGKPDPEVFLVAAGKLGVAPGRCVVVEDAVAGVQAARAGGMRCVAVSFVGHHPEEKLRAAGADLVVGSLEGVSAGAVRGLLD